MALIKISVYARRPRFRHKLEDLAFELLEQVSTRDFAAFSKTSATLEGMIKFGRIIYEIEPVNADILLQELGNLNAAIRQIAELSLPDLEKIPSIESIFSRPATLFEAVKPARKVAKSGKVGKEPAKESGNNPAILRQDQDKSGNNPAKESGNNPAIPTPKGRDSDRSVGIDEVVNKLVAEKNLLEDWANAANRESAIVERIRESGNKPVPFREIVASFPDFSGRTIRYDLQRLCNQGLLERSGGGRATLYKIRVI